MTAIETFAKFVKSLVNSEITNEKFQWGVQIIPGRKYAKIALTKPDGYRMVYCFVDIATGNILKAAGWKAPAVGIRGNISGNTSRCTPHGVS